MKNKRWKNHFRMESKSKSKKKRENRHTKNGVFCNIYEMISLAYLQCNMVAEARCNAERKNEIEKKRKCATQTRVSSSEQVFQFILALECVRASVIETSTDDDEDTTCRVCRLRCTHILHAILEILFIFVHPNSKSSRQSSVDDAIFGLLHSPHIVVDCLIYSLRYFIRFSRCVLFADWWTWWMRLHGIMDAFATRQMRVMNANSLLRAIRGSWCWLKNSNFNFRQRPRELHTWKHLHNISDERAHTHHSWI